MYWIYDEYGDFVGKVVSLSWARKMADSYDGYVENSDGYLIYDSYDWDLPYYWDDDNNYCFTYKP